MKKNLRLVFVLVVAISLGGVAIYRYYKIKAPSRKKIEVSRKVVIPQRPRYKPAPDFSLNDIQGNEVSLSDFKGKVVILDFWTTWCPPCRAEVPHFIELYNEYKDDGLEIVGVALDRNAARVAGPFAMENGISYTILIGSKEVEKLYGGIISIPTTFIIDREGGIRKKYIGYRDKEVFEKDIKELL